MDDNANILVVDDDPLVRLQLTQALRRQGYATGQANDGLQGLEALKADDFDLVLLDIVMPGLDGFGVLSRMKEDGLLSSIPVVVISAQDDMDGIVKCIRLGAEDYLPKPFDPILLQARIQACLEKKRLRETIIEQLGKYVPESVATAIIRDRGSLQPKRTTATILFSDIENFTGIAEAMSPDHVFRMLNEYFPAVVAPIMKHGGVVNQFQGDAMLVTFNVPVEDPRHAEHAVAAACEIQAVSARQNFAGVRLRTRIGINTGDVIAGNVGAGTRYNYTVHGDAVNCAARLEQLNKDYGTYTLVSGSTVALLDDASGLQAMGEVPIRGKRDAIPVFRLRD